MSDIATIRMRPRRIAIDCDGVILSWQEGFGRYVRDLLGIRLTETDFEHTDCAAYPSFAALEKEDIDWLIQDYARNGPVVLQEPRIPEYWELLREWAEPVVVTNRAEGSTRERLAWLGIDAEVVHNTGAKTGWEVLVDDWSQHCRSNEASGGRSILFQQPWSGAFGERVRDWGELVEALERRVVV